MSDYIKKGDKKLVRKSSVFFPMGIRAGHAKEIMIIDFLDPEFQGEIINSVALTKDTAGSLGQAIQRFLEDGN
ncbi:hypothetical protein PY793_04005 [Acetobacter fabarum]|uniref:hypothetical protein n=1 Tax=Acetobacter fabarum TaxID=483199 RepID=UPI00312BB516